MKPAAEPLEELPGSWQDDEENSPGELESIQYRCGFCTWDVASNKGWRTSLSGGDLRICPHCNRPTFFENESQYPDVPIGDPVQHLPADIEALYNEARRSAGANAPTSAVLSLRKLLMNIAVGKGAAKDLSFLQYVEYLASKGYVPPDGKHWVDHIRSKGNDANHEIALMKGADAEELITFAEMLLKFVYEFPARVPKKL